MNLNRAFALRLSNLLVEKKISKYRLEKDIVSGVEGLEKGKIYIKGNINSRDIKKLADSSFGCSDRLFSPISWIFSWLL